MSWRLSGNLKQVSADIKALRPKVVIYSIGDVKHMSRASDHNVDSRGIVCAIDVMLRNGFTKTDAQNLVKALKGRSDIAYLIFNRTIWSASHGWVARHYSGSDAHTDHVHVSSKHSSAADQTKKHLVWPGSKPAVPKQKVVVKPGVVVKNAPAFPADAVFHPYLNSTPPEYDTIRAFQKQLKARGWSSVEVDGRFGPGLKKAVVAYQKSHGLKADGLIGLKTWVSVFTAPLG